MDNVGAVLLIRIDDQVVVVVVEVEAVAQRLQIWAHEPGMMKMMIYNIFVQQINYHQHFMIVWLIYMH